MGMKGGMKGVGKGLGWAADKPKAGCSAIAGTKPGGGSGSGGGGRWCWAPWGPRGGMGIHRPPGTGIHACSGLPGPCRKAIAAGKVDKGLASVTRLCLALS